ncbi:Solute carrier family 43 member [Echinococcus granulosus]|uniref:Solute carrier family 43 member n=1 Tax=Echinococcus granulosus TaxID=6210 RepID=W6UWP6_ECHGR|nr:Solute carrier family 43 member [Echinococcus granulosus]EUB65071.1 Solute carrier family 43 member [Echinococcus granulosus]
MEQFPVSCKDVYYVNRHIWEGEVDTKLCPHETISNPVIYYMALPGRFAIALLDYATFLCIVLTCLSFVQTGGTNIRLLRSYCIVYRNKAESCQSNEFLSYLSLSAVFMSKQLFLRHARLVNPFWLFLCDPPFILKHENCSLVWRVNVHAAKRDLHFSAQNTAWLKFSLESKKLDQVLDLRLRQVLAIIFGTVEMLFFGGIIFGFNVLTPVLQKEGIFSYLCDKSANKTAGCSEQTTIYGYAFITYMVVQMVMLFIVGFLVDRVGLRIVKLSASILFSIGAALFAVTSATNSWLIFPAGSLVCIGGMAGLICNLSFSKLFTKTSVFVLAFITGSYDAASSVFAVFAIAYEAGFSYKLAFFLLAGVSLAMNIFSSLFIATYRLSDMSDVYIDDTFCKTFVTRLHLFI